MKSKIILGAAAFLLAVGVGATLVHTQTSFADTSKLTFWDDGSGSTTSLVDLQAGPQTVAGTVQLHGTANNAVPGSGWILNVGGQQVTLVFGADGAATTDGTVTVSMQSNGQTTNVGTATVKRVAANGTYTSDYSVVDFSVDLSKVAGSDVQTGTPVSLSSWNLGNGSATAVVGDLAASTATATGTSGTDASNVSEDGVVTDQGDADTTKGDQNNSNDSVSTSMSTDPDQWAKDGVKLTKTSTGNASMAVTTNGDTAYVYVKMADYQPLPDHNGYTFTINGKTFQVWTGDMPNNLSDGSSADVSFTGGQWNDGNQYGTVGTAKVAQFAGTNGGNYKTMVLAVDLSKLNVADTTGQQITVTNTQLGNDSVTAVGGSTGPYLLAGSGVVIAGLGFWKAKKKGLLKTQPVQVAGK
ncbi:Firmicu-CTERM sorting domain-containing protein [Lacticaseibacillus zhaodongensis]|uniref:Firmicu-CTERM sorting domain-containing protein n=1 Tax=Lacticaseibacillus zhaodongensis TaxID=2668065 RepID=UPI0012D2AB9C|nr:Firmicu-CTERM sorting domain-containing protein [Lacticaseibacillus zhaodongensis]